ncbi:MAG: S8 family serine peptidase, partial [Clostridium sp.]
MESNKVCNLYQSENSPNYIIEYRGNFKEQIDKVSYACGDVINERLGIISVPDDKILQLRIDVPAILFIEYRSVFILQDTQVNNVDKINEIKINQYLGLNGRGVLVGMVDSGIDYLNNEFIREDGTSRIESIWDQNAKANSSNPNIYTGVVYSNEEINNAIKAFKKGEDPYLVVPQRDEIYHGSKMASIIGGRGYSEGLGGVASDCNFVVVKLLESFSYKNTLKENGIRDVAVYNDVEILTAIKYLWEYAVAVQKPMVIYIGVGSTSGNHSGNSMLSTYITRVAEKRGMVIVCGVGNEGDKEGHASGTIKSIGEINDVELLIPKEIKTLSFEVWVRRPDIMAVNIITPYGESSGFIEPKVERIA